jgi:hypothetical protein
MSSSQPFISIDYWLSIADVQIITHYKNRTHNYDYSDEIKSAFVNKQTIIIFLKSDLLETYIPMLLRIEEEFILITGSNDDHCMPYMYFPCRSKELQRGVEKLVNKKQLVLWLTKNRCYEHNKIYPIPLGPKWQWKTTHFNGESKDSHMAIFNKFCKNPKEKMHDKTLKKNLLYFNYASHTTNAPLYSTHRGIREKIKKIVSKEFKWDSNVPFDKYIEYLQTCKFSISPPGRGIDTHRAWESLMVGTIPLMINTTIDPLFENLPVLFIDKWEIITPQYLETKYKEIMEKEYDFSILYTDYWNKLLNITN